MQQSILNNEYWCYSDLVNPVKAINKESKSVKATTVKVTIQNGHMVYEMGFNALFHIVQYGKREVQNTDQ